MKKLPNSVKWLIILLVLLSNCSGSPGGGYRSSSGSFGGFSTGGGHK